MDLKVNIISWLVLYPEPIQIIELINKPINKAVTGAWQRSENYKIDKNSSLVIMASLFLSLC
jgi:hypothetical protein